MCLPIHKGQEPQIATEPIVCYKCLTEDMRSPCYSQKYELGKMLISELSVKSIGGDRVEKGLHTYADKEDAETIACHFTWFNQINGFDCKTPIVVKCEIPVGATYYKGKNLDIDIVTNEYVSNQLIPLEICQ